jgi:Uma2 family endonuclease
MPATLEPIEALATPPQKKWTRDECVALERAGFLDPAQYELIEGDLLLKMSKNYPHSVALLLLANWLRKAFSELQVVQEAAIDLRPEDAPHSEPEPDLLVLSAPLTELGRKPRASDLLLVVEVSSTSLRFDLTRKADLYARSGIPEYWVLDLAARRVVVHREPSQGRYTSIQEFSGTEFLSTAADAKFQIPISQLF